MSNSELALNIQDLHYQYRSDFLLKRFHALKGLSLQVRAGESFGFLGHNGAGKTTTIKCILGLIRPSSGKIEIFGRPASDPQARNCVGYLPEQPYFYDHLRVEELLLMYAALANVPAAERLDRVHAVLTRVNMLKRKDAFMRSLSKGLTQRIGLAQALIAKPELLVLDEPFSGLDPIGRREFRDIFFELRSAGTTLFICSHILSDIEFLCDRVSILSQGELKGIFTLQDIAANSEQRFELSLHAQQVPPELSQLASKVTQQQSLCMLEFSNRDSAYQALDIARATELQIQSFQCRGRSLEELFVELVGQGKETHVQ